MAGLTDMKAVQIWASFSLHTQRFFTKLLKRPPSLLLSFGPSDVGLTGLWRACILPERHHDQPEPKHADQIHVW